MELTYESQFDVFLFHRSASAAERQNGCGPASRYEPIGDDLEEPGAKDGGHLKGVTKSRATTHPPGSRHNPRSETQRKYDYIYT
ncbi:hypothetical protein DPMN_081129 [Dreissena polymorpha]|uniref:Uncharacterized protein n=1 Tax=Dreissena polymorpha TaxID=45954 RepID=A0A9D3Y825_DREPO|nr:hypothetical protein DPMN_081129 [Dreissena polymorpha]